MPSAGQDPSNVLRTNVPTTHDAQPVPLLSRFRAWPRRRWLSTACARFEFRRPPLAVRPPWPRLVGRALVLHGDVKGTPLLTLPKNCLSEALSRPGPEALASPGPCDLEGSSAKLRGP